MDQHVSNSIELGSASMMSALLDEAPKLFVLELMLHFADIGNPYKPFAICARWAELICEVGCGSDRVSCIDEAFSLTMRAVWVAGVRFAGGPREARRNGGECVSA